MAGLAMFIALDSTVLVSALSAKEAHSPEAQGIVRAITGGVHTAVTSAIAMSEVAAVSGRSLQLDVASFFKLIHNLTVLPANESVCLKAAELRQSCKTAMRLPDALYIATALLQGADLLLTNDRQLARSATGYIQTELIADWQ